MRPTAVTFCSAWTLGLVFCLGCGGDAWKAETQPVEGHVTINGEPPVGAIVHLYPVGEKVDIRNSRPWGMVEEDGSFTLTTYESGDGAPVGEYHFTITWPLDPSSPSPTDQLEYRYSSPEKSQWRVTVVEGQTELPPIEMAGVTVDLPAESKRTRTN